MSAKKKDIKVSKESNKKAEESLKFLQKGEDWLKGQIKELCIGEFKFMGAHKDQLYTFLKSIDLPYTIGLLHNNNNTIKKLNDANKNLKEVIKLITSSPEEIKSIKVTYKNPSLPISEINNDLIIATLIDAILNYHDINEYLKTKALKKHIPNFNNYLLYLLSQEEYELTGRPKSYTSGILEIRSKILYVFLKKIKEFKSDNQRISFMTSVFNILKREYNESEVEISQVRNWLKANKNK